MNGRVFMPGVTEALRKKIDQVDFLNFEAKVGMVPHPKI